MSKVCAIFGGSRGIGQATAQLLAQKGYRLAVVARNLDIAQTTAKNLGAGHLAFSCDVSKQEDVENTFSQMEKSLGHINYLVNAAGINRDGLLLRTKVDEMVSQLHTNLLGTMLTCKLAVKSMIQQQGGAIVNVGSIVGLKGNSGQSVYSASKAGLVGFSRSLAKEVARKNIRVNVIAPGFVHTDMTTHLKEDQLRKTIPLGRFGEPQEIAKAVVFLLESPYMTGHVLVVDGVTVSTMTVCLSSLLCLGQHLMFPAVALWELLSKSVMKWMCSSPQYKTQRKEKTTSFVVAETFQCPMKSCV
ncbi:3-oxoacyl-[acyl-carrier-protein] reductase isoform X1 [Eublepharis macularius]|uniref:3-ketoacyl-[acyl-carrier-protein] reductase beta subunit n=1 Tax=Eublepharis macularius TaxID=481883 RepID=A0AA97JXG4_EUBMA|nr:3-oxoacyl-[acyl-carrier-protein] reductase isoform X1 [Eublepharis macularius]XP_054846060.1 3-oxoacyl-[acyl-carrier-protein] reductase isoform X1 [Eublepharis macularius]